MAKVANLDSIKKVLREHTAYELESVINVSRAGIGKWKNGQVEIESMSFGNAIKLTELYGKISSEEFEEVKKSVYESIPKLIKKDPDLASEIIISQIDMLLEAMSAKKDAEYK